MSIKSKIKIDLKDLHILRRKRKNRSGNPTLRQMTLWQDSPQSYFYFKGKKKLYIHRIIMNPPLGFEVDHINGDRTDNRRSNLRLCTRRQNNLNRSVSSANKIGYKGVSKYKNGKWNARISTALGVYKSLGIFKTPEDAAKAYENAARELHGEFFRV